MTKLSVYSDGFGREIQKKIQAEAGDAPQRKEPMRLTTGDMRPGELMRHAKGKPAATRTPHRWVGSGRTVFNNKGKPVRQYEPFFSATHLYESEPEMTDTGVSRVLFYDPVERVVATLHPNGTYEKVVFDPWKQESWDVNDTVCLDPETDKHVGSYAKKHVASLRARAEGWNTWYQARADGSLGAEEKAAADQASAHKEPKHQPFRLSGAPLPDHCRQRKG